MLSTEAQILPGAFSSTRNSSKRQDWELYIPVSCHWTNGGNGHDVVCLCGTINISSSELLGLKSQPLERSIMLLGCQKEVVLLVESEFVDLSHLSQSIKELSSAASRDRLILWGAVSIENVSRRRVNIRYACMLNCCAFFSSPMAFLFTSTGLLRLMLRDSTYLEPLLLVMYIDANTACPFDVIVIDDSEMLLLLLCGLQGCEQNSTRWCEAFSRF